MPAWRGLRDRARFRLVAPAVRARERQWWPKGLQQGLPDGRCALSCPHRLITPMVNKSGSPAPPPAIQQSALTPAPPRKRRGRGRPPAEDAEDVRKKLLDAARDLFPRYGYRGVSSRQIGAAAG